MTQDETSRLLIRIIDEFQWILWYQELLRIAVDQLDNRDDKTIERIELLLSSYLDQTECYFDNIQYYIKRRNELSVEVLADSQS
jgi:hypothetical protein